MKRGNNIGFVNDPGLPNWLTIAVNQLGSPGLHGANDE